MNKNIPNLRSLRLEGKNVLIRADFNVPLENGKISDSNRIDSFIPTLQEVLKQRPARVVMMSHLGEPKAEQSSLSLLPIAQDISAKINAEVSLVSISTAKSLETGICLLENLRFSPGEKSNDDGFASELASLGDVYINDAFATAHRKHASIDATARKFTQKALGLLFENELEAFNKGLHSPERPLTLVLGGSKVSSKFKVLKNIAHLADNLIIGGAMANTFIYAISGVNLGRSLVEPELKDEVLNFVESLGKKTKLFLPDDVIVAPEINAPQGTIRKVSEIKSDEMALDVGPSSLENLRPVIASSKTIVWNGPLGAFEFKPFAGGTLSLAKMIGETAAFSIVGGGDTDAAIHQAGVEDGFSYMSTGGGAFLKLLEGETLPAVAAILA